MNKLFQIKNLLLAVLLLITANSFGQDINPRLSIVPECDTSKIFTHIGEIYYFGKNMEKAKAYPQLNCYKGNKRCVVLWVSSKRYKKRAEIKLEQLNEYVFEKKDNGFEEFPSYAFFIDSKATKFSKNILYETKFPSIVEVHRYDNGGWIKLFDKNVTSSDELGALQLEVIKKK